LVTVHWAWAEEATVSKRARHTTHWRITVVALSAMLVTFVALQSEVVLDLLKSAAAPTVNVRIQLT
jgi:hypothetical protein